MRKLRGYEFGVADEAEARSILRRLRLDGSRVVARFLVDSPLTSTVRGKVAVFAMSALSLLAFLAALAMRTEMRWAFASLALIAFIALAVSTSGGFVTVGTDGVALERRFTRRRFVPYAALASLRLTDRGVTLVEHDGHTLDLDFGAGSRQRAQERRDEFVMRVDEARACNRDGESRIDAARVSRGTRTAGEWLDALRALARSEGGMRTAPVVRSQLFALVEDPRLGADARSGAAAAIAIDASASERDRLRAMAASTAEPRLRVVLEAAAGTDPQRLTVALDAVRDEGSTGARTRTESS